MTDQLAPDAALVHQKVSPEREEFDEWYRENANMLAMLSMGWQRAWQVWQACARHEAQQEQIVRNAMVTSIERLTNELAAERAALLASTREVERLSQIVRELGGAERLSAR